MGRSTQLISLRSFAPVTSIGCSAFFFAQALEFGPVAALDVGHRRLTKVPS